MGLVAAVTLLAIGAVLVILSRRLRVPYTAALVVAGIALAATPLAPQVRISPGLVYDLLLPPLIFDAAIRLQWKDLRRDAGVIGTYATLGFALAAAVTATAMHFAAGWPVAAATLFAVLISATDPVSVIATFRETGVTGRLALLVEAESLMNDGTAAVAFGIFAATGAAMPSAAMALARFAGVVAGSAAVGLIVAGLLLLLAGATSDHLVELAFTTVIAWSAFLVAERLHLSGVLAAVAAGLLTGNVGAIRALTERGREALYAFWEFAAFVANVIVFLVIGVQFARHISTGAVAAIAIAILAVTAGRAAAVYGFALAFARTRARLAPADQHALVWGGLRGALALALALSLPASTPLRNQIVAATFAVVGFTVVVQGATMAPMLRRLQPGGSTA